MRREARLAAGGFVAVLAAACGGTGAAPAAAPPPGPAPAEPITVKEVSALTTGDLHTCAILATGAVACWGRNRDGELGDGGAAGNRTRPIIVPNLRDVAQLACGHGFSCARLRTGRVKCWGSGKILGDDRAVERIRPTDVEGLEGVVDLQAGGVVTCARTQSGAVRCWGTPKVQAGGLSAGADDVAVAGAHACARTLDGQVTCWGEGLAKNPKQAGPEFVKASSLSTGDSFVCVASAGLVRCWGRNDQGELGSPPDAETRLKPVVVKNLEGVTKLTSAETRTCALSGDGTVRCWGGNAEGALGQGTRSPTALPSPVVGISDAIDVAVGAGHACALTRTKDVYCWGSNRHGQLGDGSLESHPTPVKVRF